MLLYYTLFKKFRENWGIVACNLVSIFLVLDFGSFKILDLVWTKTIIKSLFYIYPFKEIAKRK